MIDLDALEALEKKASKAKWTVRCSPNGCHYDRTTRDGYAVNGVKYVPDYENPMLCKDDAALIAAARNALPELIRLARIGQRVERDATEGTSAQQPASPGPCDWSGKCEKQYALNECRIAKLERELIAKTAEAERLREALETILWRPLGESARIARAALAATRKDGVSGA